MSVVSDRIAVVGHPGSRLLRSLSYVTATHVFMAATQLVTTALLARVMRPEGLGIYFLLLNIGEIGSLLCKAGADQANQKFLGAALAMQREQVPVIVRRINALALGVSAITVAVLAAAWSLARHVPGFAALDGWMLVGIAVVLLVAVEDIQSATLRAADWMWQSSLASGVIRRCVFLLGLALAAGAGATPLEPGLVMGLWLATSAVGVAFGGYWVGRFLVTMPRGPRAGEPAPSVREIAGVAVPLAAANGMNVIRNAADVLIIGAVFGPAAVGSYGPVKVCAKVVVFLLEPASKAMAPIVAGLRRAGATLEIESVCRRAATYSALVAVPATAVLFVAGGPILAMAFGPSYRDAGLLLAIFCVGPCVRAVVGLPAIVLQMSGHHVLVMRVNVLLTVAGLVAMAAVARPLGLIGLAAVSSALVVAQVGILAASVYRLFGIRTYAELPSRLRRHAA